MGTKGDLPDLIHAIGAGAKRARDLTRAEAFKLARAVVNGEADPVQIGGILIAWRVKGESADELAGVVDALAEGLPQIPARSLAPLGSALGAPPGVDVDLHGDGHENRPSTALAAACVASSAGVRVLLRAHLRSPHSHVGLTRLAGIMGLAPARDAAHAAHMIQQGVPALLDSTAYHPRLADLLDHRDLLGVRTAIHTAVKLLDPAGFGAHLVGIFHAPYHDPVAGALALVGSRRALIVRAPGGLPEPSPDRMTPIGVQLAGAAPRLIEIAPLDLLRGNGVSPDAGSLPAGGPDDAALLALDVLERGVRGPIRHAILVGAAAQLYAAGVESDMVPAFARAETALDKRLAARTLDHWRSACARR